MSLYLAEKFLKEQGYGCKESCFRAEALKISTGEYCTAYSVGYGDAHR